ncbi:MAG: membrane protein insertase YidC [Chitinophagaceae bacterium]|nr:membrane protein insertase YidC [Chitinophagaceae bacterium]
MGMDRNTIIGFVLLAILFFGYFYYTQQGQLALEKERTHVQDSLNRLKPIADTIAAKPDSVKKDSAVKGISNTFIQDSVSNIEQLTTLENAVLKITFTNKGGQPKIVELKIFKTFDGKSLVLQNGNFNKISYTINTSVNQTAQTADLSFKVQQDSSSQSNPHAINFIVQNPDGQIIEHQYNLSDSGYILDFNIKLNGADKLITQNKINLTWQAQASQVEKDFKHENIQSHVGYVVDGDYDFETVGSGGNEKFDKQVDWVTLKQQFFATAIIAKNKFESADVQWTVPSDTNLHIIAQATSNCRISLPGGSVANIPLQLLYGPIDYKILKSYGNQMHNTVDLGSGVFAFVKYINRGFIMPVFNFLGSKFASYGLVIALLTIIIRLLISPLTYQSYLSGAKMKLLKPEIDALKVKYGDDKQAFGMEQMKLFKSAGVNPLGGCIPALLQIPIFFALYSFFNSNIALRGQSFWWAKDLSSYDSILDFGYVPILNFLYGGHISLFTIFAVVTSLLISIYGMANMQDTGNPIMKYMPYIFPVILLGVFNSQPAALTWYYTVSNVITLVIQFVIQKYIINHEKILAKLEENKKKPKVKSKWQERIEAMQASNQKLQTMKQKVNKSKK